MSGDRGYEKAVAACVEELRLAGQSGVAKHELMQSTGYSSDTVSHALSIAMREHGVSYAHDSDAACRRYYAEGCKPEPKKRIRTVKAVEMAAPEPVVYGSHTAWMLANNWPPGFAARIGVTRDGRIASDESARVGL